jgi:hypothetical protein
VLKKTVTIVLIFISHYGFTQQSVVSSGSSVVSNQGSFSFSIGQILTSQIVILSGVSSSSIIIVTMNGTGNNQFLKNVVPGSNEFTINMNGDPGDGTKFSYIVITP